MPIPRSWTRPEVEATIADYLEMLRAEVTGEQYSKAEHRRGLARLLNGRSQSAIERKHQNISAVLIELGWPYIDGYKPLSNYQGLLADVVADRLSEAHELAAILRLQVESPATLPTVEDILAAMERPPERARGPAGRERFYERPRPAGGTAADYLGREARNASLGAAGEEFVLRYERARLLRARKETLAGRIERVSVTEGDWLGYDIRSFEEDGSPRLIEVKTTRYAKRTPFYVTRNEVAISKEEAARYHLYRAFDFRVRPRLFQLQGALDKVCRLDATAYVARVA